MLRLIKEQQAIIPLTFLTKLSDPVTDSLSLVPLIRVVDFLRNTIRCIV